MPTKPKPKKKQPKKTAPAPGGPTSPSPFERPKSGDKSDIRCAFVLDRKGRHDLGQNPTSMWCYGCDFYICDACDSPFGAPGVGKHDVIEHDPASE